jgi:ribonuclease HI
MSDASALTIYTDGAARGNPGPAAFAYIISRDGALVVEEAGCLGETTNNIAEYTALVRALEHAVKLSADTLVIHSDSELLVKQMKGEYRVKNEDLKTLFEEAKRLSRRFRSVSLVHVRRDQNSDADRLCNQALDGVRGTGSATAPAKKKPKKAVSAEREQSIREEAVACLRAAAATWAKGNPDHPEPEQVWDQLWSILEEQGLLRRGRES